MGVNQSIQDPKLRVRNQALPSTVRKWREKSYFERKKMHFFYQSKTRVFRTFRQFTGEYRNMVGDSIPYRNFGFNSLHDFLDDAKHICKVGFGPDGAPIVRSVSSEETFHIQVSNGLRYVTSCSLRYVP